jgi:uncharacterized protein (TIGR03435 family)
MQEGPNQEVRTVLKIASAVNGIFIGQLYRLDPDVGPIPVTSISLQGKTVKFAVVPMDVTYEGKLSTDGGSVTGTWTHFSVTHDLNLRRVDANSAWSIPPPIAHTREMPSDADPAFEVATIKPSAPDNRRKGLDFQGRHFVIYKFSANELIGFAYGLHTKQIIGAPAWFGTNLYDIDGVPNVQGDPSINQMKALVQKLLADRLKLVFHHDKRVLVVYAITLSKGGPKLISSARGTNEEYDFSFPRRFGGLTVRNLTMADFATWMQALVLDKPVIDQTGLTGRYDFTLNWTPDGPQIAQYNGAGSASPSAVDDPTAPPDLYTALQEQLGLKLESEKAPDDVMIVDHVERPSPN